jgi:hypothetical protein
LRSIELASFALKYNSFSVNEREVRLEEVLRRLEAVHPWAVEKVSKTLDVDFKKRFSDREVTIYEKREVLYEEDQYVNSINLGIIYLTPLCRH